MDPVHTARLSSRDPGMAYYPCFHTCQDFDFPTNIECSTIHPHSFIQFNSTTVSEASTLSSTLSPCCKGFPRELSSPPSPFGFRRLQNLLRSSTTSTGFTSEVLLVALVDFVFSLTRFHILYFNITIYHRRNNECPHLWRSDCRPVPAPAEGMHLQEQCIARHIFRANQCDSS